DYAGVVCAAGAAAVMDEETEGDGEERGAGDDEGLEVAHEADDDTGDQTSDDGDEAVVALQIPRRVEENSDHERGPDTAVFEQTEGNHGVFAVFLPQDKDGDGENTHDEGGDDMSRLPGLFDASREGEGDEDEGEDSDDEDYTDNVQLPEQLNGELFKSQRLERRLERSELTRAIGAAAGEKERDEEWHGADGEDDGPHADSPFPAWSGEDGGRYVAADPGVDLVCVSGE
ncbi:hypothetical protein V495_07981, partial [Pseudogymnoascus sp. VKM F-4514 (FW-929)]